MTTRMIERWFPCAEVSKYSAKWMGKPGSLRRACSLGSHPGLSPRQRQPSSALYCPGLTTSMNRSRLKEPGS